MCLCGIGLLLLEGRAHGIKHPSSSQRNLPWSNYMPISIAEYITAYIYAMEDWTVYNCWKAVRYERQLWRGLCFSVYIELGPTSTRESRMTVIGENTSSRSGVTVLSGCQYCRAVESHTRTGTYVRTHTHIHTDSWTTVSTRPENWSVITSKCPIRALERQQQPRTDVQRWILTWYMPT